MLRFSMVKYAILGLGCLGLSSCGSADRSSTRGAVLDRDGGLVCTVAKDGEPIQVSQQGTKEFVDLYNDLKELSGRAQGKRQLTE
jgi:hypothetical protein